MKTFYVTTPIYYPSGKFHIGTAYTEVLANFLKKFHQMLGEDSFMLTGTDEHGQKIQDKALENNMDPKSFVDIQVDAAKKLWKKMKIDYDKYMRTTDSYHEKAVKKIFEKFLSQGDIYLGEYEGWYCKPCEGYFTETQLDNGNCPDCGRPVKKMKEEAYFFNMKKYEKRLMDYYDSHSDFIVPEYRKQEMINNFIKPGLEDLCITRTSFDWGIKVPNNSKHVIYVWLDALTNYITALGFLSEDETLFKKYWPANVQLIGKDIARFHLIYWPIFLMALELPLPEKIYIHNWVTMKDGKMSKSKGNVIYPEQLIERYGLDMLKYYLLREMPMSTDVIFTPETFIERYNSDLCNDLSNLLNRTVSMINRYISGNIPNYVGIINESDIKLEEKIKETIKRYMDLVDKFEFSNSIQSIWSLISRTNKYIDETEPWNLSKNSGTKKKLESCLNHLVCSLRVIAILIRPLMEDTSNNILNQLGFENRNIMFKDLENYKDFKNKKVIENPQPMFMRLEKDKEIEYIKGLMNS